MEICTSSRAVHACTKLMHTYTPTAMLTLLVRVIAQRPSAERDSGAGTA